MVVLALGAAIFSGFFVKFVKNARIFVNFYENSLI